LLALPLPRLAGGKTGDFTHLVSTKIIFFPGWDRLQGENFATLLKADRDSIRDGMPLKLVHCIIILQIQR